jgi:hypothetical protein
MLLKWYHHLHPMSRSKVGYVEQTIYENFNLNIFQQIVNTIEPTKKNLIIKEMFDFKTLPSESKKNQTSFERVRKA